MALLNDNSPMPYGKHKGKAMANVPDDYLLWLYNNDKCTYPVRKYVEMNMDAIKTNINNCR